MQDNAGATAGNGGIGVASSITGSSVTRAGGGGGGSVTGGTSLGGVGGGGDGSSSGGNAGVINTGGGGGGGGSTAGIGGSGVVILKLPKRAIANFSAGVTQSNAIVGDFRIYTITATSTISETVTIL